MKSQSAHIYWGCAETNGEQNETGCKTATEVDAFVGLQLKSLRKAAKFSQTELANQVGVTFQQIQKYERGTNRIGASRLWEFCKVFDVPPGRFFDGVDEFLIQEKDNPSMRESA